MKNTKQNLYANKLSIEKNDHTKSMKKELKRVITTIKVNNRDTQDKGSTSIIIGGDNKDYLSKLCADLLGLEKQEKDKISNKCLRLAIVSALTTKSTSQGKGVKSYGTSISVANFLKSVQSFVAGTIEKDW